MLLMLFDHLFFHVVSMPDHSHYRCDVEGQHRALKLVEGVVKRHMGLGYSRRLGMEVSSTKTNACGHIDDEEMGVVG